MSYLPDFIGDHEAPKMRPPTKLLFFDIKRMELMGKCCSGYENWVELLRNVVPSTKIQHYCMKTGQAGKRWILMKNYLTVYEK